MSAGSTNYTYDAENRMTAVSGAAAATFVYDGDGNRVKGVVGGVTTTYIGNYFEWTPSGKTTLRVQAGSTSTMKKYYYAGGTRVAERKGTTLYWLLSDHLGSTSITATSSGSKTAELRYKPWGETRYTSGTTQTTIRYTGQREESSLGLYWYASRWYSPGLGRFVSPDTIIPQPGNPQAWDRYAYTYSNPVRYVDPSGHKACENFDEDGCCTGPIGLGYVLLHEFGWITQGNWHDSELSEILKSGRDIRNFVNGIVPDKGEAWMDKFMGGVTFKHGSLFGYSYVIGSSVHLVESLPNRWITHELVHVYDNRSAQDMGNAIEALWLGGGNADLMHEWLGGGEPQGLRFMNGTSNLPVK